VREARPDGFHTTLPATTDGWHWLAAPESTATWHFAPLTGHDDHSIDLCLEARSSNSEQGGSGHDSELHVRVNNLRTAVTYTTTLTLDNRSNIVTERDSGGVGYASDGCVRLRAMDLTLDRDPFDVVVSYPEGNPTAVRADAASIIYTVP